MPKFSIVVPAYNASDTLAQTLEAVVAQEYHDWECIVVDDGSTDETLSIAEGFADVDKRFSVVSQENRGTGGAYNTGVATASGDWVTICSADDVLLPECLRRMNEFIEDEPGFDVYSANGYFWLPDGTRQLVYARGTHDEVMSLSLADVIRVCFYSVGAAYRRDWHQSVGGYREDVFGEDYDFWLRCMANGATHRYLPRALSLHRVSPSQKSANLERAYLSDIRLVSDLLATNDLDDTERTAVAEAVVERRKLIERLGEPARTSTVRVVLRRGLSKVLGPRAAAGLVSAVRALLRRSDSRDG